jgi:anti-anti-sigma factor
LQFVIQNRGDAILLKCSGRFVAGQELSKLHRTATSQRAKELVLDLAGVEIIDAGGLGALLRIKEQCDRQGTALKLANPTKQVRRVLQLTALDLVFDISEYGSDNLQLERQAYCCLES